MTVASNPGSQGPGAKQPAHALQKLANTQVHSSCYVLICHWLKHARSTPGFEVPSMISCISSPLLAGCLVLLFSSPAYLHELHKQLTDLTHGSEFQPGQVLEVHCCKDNSFFGSALRWGWKEYRRKASTGQNATHFPTSFYLFSN